MDAHHEAQVLLVVGDREPVFDQDDAGADQQALEFRRGVEEVLVLLVGAEAHDALDAGPIVPAAVEQHDLAARRQMRDIALEIPLGALALARRGQRDDPADARIEPLRDALDDAALARGIAALEHHDDLQLLMHDPVLQLDQFALQAKQLVEIEPAARRSAEGVVAQLIHQAGNMFVVDFHLQLFVEIVDEFAMNSPHESVRRLRSRFGHFWFPLWLWRRRWLERRDCNSRVMICVGSRCPLRSGLRGEGHAPRCRDGSRSASAIRDGAGCASVSA